MIIHIDLSTGASGDKLMAALLELSEGLGVADFAGLEAVAKALVPGVLLTRTEVNRGGISATHLTVEEFAQGDNSESGRDSGRGTGHGLEHGSEHGQEHESGHGHNQPHHHPQQHSHWSEIRQMIEVAAQKNVISTTTATKAITAFEIVARAEAAVHGVDIDQVHFHEVGAADSIIDIVGSSFLLDALAPTAVYATPMALGNGTVICQHGELPVPAPATARILADAAPELTQGIPVYAGLHDGELTTPTGAALIRTFVTNFEPLPCSEPLAVGCGAGSKEIPQTANVLRIIAAQPTALAGLQAPGDSNLTVEGLALLEANIDHRTPEALAFVCDELARKGALDVWQESITMKKGRLAVRLCLLCQVAEAQELAGLVIELTGSLGVRSSYVERTKVSRDVITLQTPYGDVPFKAAEYQAPGIRRAWLRPEHQAVAAIARKQSLDYQTVYDELMELGARQHR